MLLPKLLEPADHATAANLLIAHLAEATRLGAAAEALIRLPVLATLGLLNVDAGTAKKLLTAVLNVSRLDHMLLTLAELAAFQTALRACTQQLWFQQICTAACAMIFFCLAAALHQRGQQAPCMTLSSNTGCLPSLQILDSVRSHELPSAAGLVLKLASQSSGPARLAAVKAVRQKLRLTPQAMTPGVLDAFRLVVMQHADVAQEIVEGIDRQCGSLAASSSPPQVLPLICKLVPVADYRPPSHTHIRSCTCYFVVRCFAT